tara:strand:- start:940 stop:1197 length:258 start_codon:yes stop_codon:yes gene_type:complete
MANIDIAKSGNIPALALNRPSSQTWTTTGNTHTITNAHIKADSVLLIVWTAAGGSLVSQVPADGSCALTAENSVEANITFKYIIL